MKHIVHALAIIDKAQQQLELERNAEMLKFQLELEKKYATPRRMLADARKTLTARLASVEAIKEDYFGELRKPTPKTTTQKIRRAQKWERDRRRRYAD